MGAIIEARGLTKRYGEHTAVDNVDLSIEAGACFGILGPNGAGKTTLIEMIEGIRRPDAGQALITGLPVWPRNDQLLPRIGVQFQATAFFDKLTTIEQIRTFADLYGAPRTRCEELLDQVGLTDQAGVDAKRLSGGQQQRLSIACSLVHDPEVIFMDEPTAALDPQARRNLWDLLRTLNDRGQTVVLTTHYMDEAQILCDQVAIIDHGKILEVDTPRALITGLDAPYRITIEAQALPDPGSLPEVEEVHLDAGTVTVVTRRPAPVLAALAERDALDGLQVAGATLEDVFLALTGREYRG